MKSIHMPNNKFVSIDAAFNTAMVLHQEGKIIRAAKIYGQIIKMQPRHADAVHLLGVTNSQQAKFDKAVELIRSAIIINPGVSIYHSNLSHAYRMIGSFSDAMSACLQALKIDPNNAVIHLNKGLIAYDQELYELAIISYNRSLSLSPDNIDALLGIGDSYVKAGKVEDALSSYQKILTFQSKNMAALTRVGISLRLLDRVTEAVDHYKKAISQLPAEPDLYNNLALLYQSSGKNTEAANCLKKLLELTPEDETTRHMLHALEGVTPESAPAEYVRDVFDNYADGFEEHLVNKLGYNTPKLLAEVILGCVTQRTGLSVLDLGCGTGLMGMMLQGHCSHLAGVDLAPKMIEQTRKKGIYQDLVVGDVVEFMLNKDDGCYDIVVAADVFVYIGDLGAIFAEAKRLLLSGGVFAFSVEASDDESEKFVLNKTGRYGHSRKYLQSLQETYGFAEKHYSKAHIRNQKGKPVYGYLCVYQRPL